MEYFDIFVHIASNADIASSCVLMLMILGLEQPLSILSRQIDCKPAFVVRMHDEFVIDTRRNEPVSDCFDGILMRSEGLVDLLSRPMLAEIGRIRMGAIYIRTRWITWTLAHSHVH